MSFTNNSLGNSKKSQSQMIGPFGVVDRMIHGLGTIHSELLETHPLEKKLTESKEEEIRRDFKTLRASQGIQAPLKLMMERKAASQIHRLPCLASSHIMLDTLLGSDDTISHEDIFNDPYNSERLIQPHIDIEMKSNFS